MHLKMRMAEFKPISLPRPCSELSLYCQVIGTTGSQSRFRITTNRWSGHKQNKIGQDNKRKAAFVVIDASVDEIFKALIRKTVKHLHSN